MPAVAQDGHFDPVAFGQRYWLVRQLAVGGMAEIYLARQNAMAGFEKDVVIKRLKPELAGDPRIVEMFLDEARIGAQLNHPNIVHVYDVDEQDGVPYIAMELIVGEELNQLCRRGLALRRFLPLEHAVELMRQAAAGMGYFHHKRKGHVAEHGEPMDIVHLDISPTNLLVTEDGFLKIIDFGIAKARNQRFREEGAIPGKLSYMSPEQAARGKVDHRSDIFSLGVVLYEITVGRRLFKGPAAEVVKKLTDGKIEPPTFAKREFPGALESVVMRCLERHPDDRYQSAYDLADDLEEFLRTQQLHSEPVKIARYLDELSIASGGSHRPELVGEANRGERDAGDDLDFDSKVFDGYRAAEVEPARAPKAAEWDEYEEGDEALAAALGMDFERLKLMRTPVPVAPSPAVGLPLRAPARTPDPRLKPLLPAADDPASEDLTAPRPQTEPPDSAPAMVHDRPRVPTPAPGTPAQVPPPRPRDGTLAEPSAEIKGPPASIAPYVVLGGLGVALLGAIAYFAL